MIKKVAFLDTMVFLHFLPLDQIDWCKLLQADEVELVIAPVVYRQLERHKDHNREGLRSRAKATVARLKDWFGAVRACVTLKLVHQEPRIEFAEYNLVRDVEDDQLIASALEHQQATRQPVSLVTEDGLLMAKARAAGLKVVEPPNEARLPDALSEHDKKIRSLEAENQRLRNVPRPQLVVSFDSGEKYARFDLRPLGSLSEKEHGRLLMEERGRRPHLDVPPRPRWTPEMARAIPGFDDTAAAINYNCELDEYFEEYSLYLERDHKYREALTRSVEFTLRVRNVGRAPASDIDVLVRADAPVSIFAKGSSWPKAPGAPKVPELPDASPVHGLLGVVPPSYLADYSIVMPDLPDTWAPSIQVTSCDDGLEIDANIGRIKHTQGVDLGPFLVEFVSVDAIRPFTMSYSVNCEELGENVEGELHLVVKRAD